MLRSMSTVHWGIPPVRLAGSFHNTIVGKRPQLVHPNVFLELVAVISLTLRDFARLRWLSGPQLE